MGAQDCLITVILGFAVVVVVLEISVRIRLSGKSPIGPNEPQRHHSQRHDQQRAELKMHRKWFEAMRPVK